MCTPLGLQLLSLPWERCHCATQVAADVSSFLEPGEAFRLMHTEDFFGEPAVQGTCQGETISVPMDTAFGAFVLLRG